MTPEIPIKTKRNKDRITAMPFRKLLSEPTEARKRTAASVHPKERIIEITFNTFKIFICSLPIGL